jgi:hypothetical protein
MSPPGTTFGSTTAILKHLILLPSRKKSILLLLLPVLLPPILILYYPHLSLLLSIITLLLRLLYITHCSEGGTGFAEILPWGMRNMGWGLFWGSGVVILGEIALGGLRASVLGGLRYVLVWVEDAEEEQLGKEWRLGGTGGKGCVRLIWGVSLCLMCPGGILEYLSAGLIIVSMRLLRAIHPSTRQHPESAVFPEETNEPSDPPLSLPSSDADARNQPPEFETLCRGETQHHSRSKSTSPSISTKTVLYS